MKTQDDLEEGMIIGTCSWCHNENVPIFEDSQHCNDCDDRFTYCSVCKEEQFEDDHCRHIFWSDNGWSGSGGEYSSTDIRASLGALLKAMPNGFPQDLKIAIQSGKFRTFIVGCIMGSVNLIELHGTPGGATKYSHELIELGQGELAEQMADGWGWLQSLEEDKTTEANNLTIQWIDEFMKEMKEINET